VPPDGAAFLTGKARPPDTYSVIPPYFTATSRSAASAGILSLMSGVIGRGDPTPTGEHLLNWAGKPHPYRGLEIPSLYHGSSPSGSSFVALKGDFFRRLGGLSRSGPVYRPFSPGTALCEPGKRLLTVRVKVFALLSSALYQEAGFSIRQNQFYNSSERGVKLASGIGLSIFSGSNPITLCHQGWYCLRIRMAF
jgi:hypothetical protein